VKWTQKNFLNAYFRRSGSKYSPISLKDCKSSRDRLTRIVILTNFGSIPRNLGIFSIPGDSKLTPDGLGLQWNGHSKTFWTLTLELLGRNIAPLHFKSERVAEGALGASWFWPTSPRFPGTWAIFYIAGDSKLTPHNLGLQRNGHSITFWTLTFELLGPKFSPTSF